MLTAQCSRLSLFDGWCHTDSSGKEGTLSLQEAYVLSSHSPAFVLLGLVLHTHLFSSDQGQGLREFTQAEIVPNVGNTNPLCYLKITNLNKASVTIFGY